MELILNNNIIQVRDDGFMNLTQMCKACGKSPNEYLSNKSTKNFIEVLSLKLGINKSNIVDIKRGGNNGGTFAHPLIIPHILYWLHPELKDQYIKQENDKSITLVMPDIKPKSLKGYIYIIHFKQSIDDENNMIIKVGKTQNLSQRLKQHDSYAFFGLDHIRYYNSNNIDVDENKLIYEASLLSKQLKPEAFLFTRENLDKLLTIIDSYYEI